MCQHIGHAEVTTVVLTVGIGFTGPPGFATLVGPVIELASLVGSRPLDAENSLVVEATALRSINLHTYRAARGIHNLYLSTREVHRYAAMKHV
jgi:hypothetical protein